MSRPIPASLRRDGATQRTNGTPPPSEGHAPSEAPVPAPLIVYLAVPHPKLLDAIRRTRIFVSVDVPPVEVRAFHAPEFPHLSDDALRLLGRLTEIGEVVDQPLEIITPEILK